MKPNTNFNTEFSPPLPQLPDSDATQEPRVTGSINHKAADPDKLIKPETVRELCGGVSDMSIWRWLQDPELGFPVPVHIANKRYWFEAEVRNWIQTRRRTSKRDAG